MSSKKIVVAFAVMLLLLPSIPLVIAEDALKVETDAKYYKPGESVEITGEASPGALVHVVVNRASLQLFEDDVNATLKGEFNATYVLPTDAEIGVYTVNASTTTSQAQTSFTVMKVDFEEMAIKMIELAEEAQDEANEANETLTELREEGIDILSSAIENYEHGVDALEKAKSLLEEDKYTVAMEMAHSALVHFGNAIHMAAMSAEKADEDGETRETVQLGQQIDRAYRLVEKLNATIIRLEEEGKDTSAIEALIAEAKSLLDQASAAFDEGRLDEAEAALESAEDAIEGAMNLLNEMTSETKLECMERFRERLQARLNSTEKAIEKLGEHVAEMNRNAVMAQIRKIHGQLDRIREMIREGKSNEAFKGLEDASKEFDEGLDELDGHAYGQTIREMNRLQATIQAMQRSLPKWGKWGFNAAELENRINLNLERVDEILENLGQNLVQKAKGLAKKGIDDFRNPPSWARGPTDKGSDEGSDFPWSKRGDNGGSQGNGKGKGGK